MGAGCSRNLDRFATGRFTPQYNNQSHRDSCICSLLLSIACFFSIGLCGLFSQDLSAQTSTAASVSPTHYAVSASELRVPPKAWAYLAAAHKEFSRGNLEKAEREVERALQVDPTCGPAFSIRAFIRLAEKNPSAALADATLATSIDAHDSDAFVALAMAYNSLKDFENAIKAATQALALQPDSWQAQLEMAKSLYGKGQFDAALTVLNALAKDFPDVHLVRGNVLMNLAQRQEAVAEFMLFLREAPVDPRSEQVRRICAATVAGGVMESASVPR
jgi:tetratricopeptide (TPR) repeat protein